MTHKPCVHVKMHLILCFFATLDLGIEFQSSTWDKDDLCRRLMKASEIKEIYPAAEVRRHVRNLREHNISGARFVKMSVSDFVKLGTPEKLAFTFVNIGEYFNQVILKTFMVNKS